MTRTRVPCVSDTRVRAVCVCAQPPPEGTPEDVRKRLAETSLPDLIRKLLA